MTASLDCFGGARLLGKLTYNASSITPIYNYGNSGIVRPALPAGTTHVFGKVWGADAAESNGSGNVGAVGGLASGLITLSNTSGTLIICVGGMGESFLASHRGGLNGGAPGGGGYASGGAGYSAIFNDTGVTYPPLLIMAGGAGGLSSNGGQPLSSGAHSGLYIGDGATSPGSGSYGPGSGGGYYGGQNGSGGSSRLDASITHGSLVLQTAGTLVKPNSTDPDFVTPTQDYPAVTGAYNGLIVLLCFSGDPFAAGLLP